ncbi:MAG: fibronectin type III domain-containing protein [Acidobacteria bacterium]|uniref:Fibronectin type III domain-containing protein n=1 Tax=Candidatus Polarisedimenticola svalbardensis TaxID=2886004 RepID=A0A8J6XXL0_9BACT|nr:fibronectin type III domain-containing protein [Candidatus Polarisedimenticola svalbardensis]
MAAGEVWQFPERFRDRLVPGHRSQLSLADTLVDIQVIGIGWVHLAEGPREVVLQRAVVYAAGSTTLVYRWIDPASGVLAEVEGSGVPGLTGLQSVVRGSVSGGAINAAADLKIYSDEVIQPVETYITYGWDLGENTQVSSLTPEAHANIGDLIAADSWDFSSNTAGTSVAQTERSVSSAETCNYNQCGYDLPGTKLTRQDHGFDGVDGVTNNQVTEVSEDGSGITVWLRAGRQQEGVTGAFGVGETGFCWITDATETRTPVRLWEFAHQDAEGWYLQAGDAWTDGPFNCQQSLLSYSNGCGSGSWPTELYVDSCSGFSGTQSGEVIKGGVVTLPSGHTLNALLVRTVAEYCVYASGSCLFAVDDVRTVIYLWQVPELGTVVLLQSFQSAPDFTSFTELENTNITFGLFPPLSVTVTGSAVASVDLAWNPGNDTSYIDGYKLYWGTSSGSLTPYTFNSVDNAGQVSITDTTATISGLDPDTDYFFAVTSTSDYQSPDSGLVVRHESMLYPTQVSGDPDHVYPVEVMAHTSCGGTIPTVEAQNLVLEKLGSQVELCWDAAEDSCLEGYDVLGSDTSDSAGGFSVIGTTDGATTCWQGNPSQSYFIVTVRGAGSSGPWGHYGQ